MAESGHHLLLVGETVDSTRLADENYSSLSRNLKTPIRYKIEDDKVDLANVIRPRADNDAVFHVEIFFFNLDMIPASAACLDLPRSRGAPKYLSSTKGLCILRAILTHKASV
ncbi:OLC1v1010661C2 [Oldenlandia corymbosa var. corymbosa]|uniref:OLC1v1010661C2 n=1 Tax=Oldenlandia corymbosa var. corymbosa TaxID=529605 RepID=A0AAV1DUK0_OLDCO|nr:OLC1v1010661C2 [Oldenlandia corymbosa var. corymbosa]